MMSSFGRDQLSHPINNQDDAPNKRTDTPNMEEGRSSFSIERGNSNVATLRPTAPGSLIPAPVQPADVTRKIPPQLDLATPKRADAVAQSSQRAAREQQAEHNSDIPTLADKSAEEEVVHDQVHILRPHNWNRAIKIYHRNDGNPSIWSEPLSPLTVTQPEAKAAKSSTKKAVFALEYGSRRHAFVDDDLSISASELSNYSKLESHQERSIKDLIKCSLTWNAPFPDTRRKSIYVARGVERTDHCTKTPTTSNHGTTVTSRKEQIERMYPRPAPPRRRHENGSRFKEHLEENDMQVIHSFTMQPTLPPSNTPEQEIIDLIDGPQPMVRLPTPKAGENIMVGKIEYAETKNTVVEQGQCIKNFQVDQEDQMIGARNAIQKESSPQCGCSKSAENTAQDTEPYRLSWSGLAVLSVLFLTCCIIAVIKLANHTTGVGYAVAAQNSTNGTLKAIDNTGRATFNTTDSTSAKIQLYPTYTLKLSNVQKKGICDDGVDPTWELEHEAQLAGMENLGPQLPTSTFPAIKLPSFVDIVLFVVMVVAVYLVCFESVHALLIYCERRWKSHGGWSKFCCLDELLCRGLLRWKKVSALLIGTTMTALTIAWLVGGVLR